MPTRGVDEWAARAIGAWAILTVKVGSSGAGLVADSATELSSLSTFWSSAFTLPTRNAALAAAAATLILILMAECCLEQLSDGNEEWEVQKRKTKVDGRMGRNRLRRQTIDWGWAMDVAPRARGKEKSPNLAKAAGVVNLKLGGRFLTTCL